MWGTILPHTSCSWEPVELRILKQELANLACKCNMCETFKNPSLHKRGYQNDEAVQVEQRNHLLDRYIYATSDIPRNADDTQLDMMDYFRKDVFCPNCYFIWDLLRRTAKVFKDEGSEMKPDSSDKSTEKAINFADSATATNRPSKMSSNLTLCDFISECSSSKSSVSNRNNDTTFEVVHSDKKKYNHDRVTFLDDYSSSSHENVRKEPPPTLTIHGNCFCLENFMESIRPPLKNVL